MTASHRRRNPPVKVVVVAPHDMDAELLASVLSRGKSNFLVTTVVGTSHAVSTKLLRRKPDVALISEDLEDGERTGFKVLRKLRESDHSAALIVLLKSSRADSVVDAFRHGARGVFSRNAPLKALGKCIQTVRQGHICVSGEDLEHLVKSFHGTRRRQVASSTALPLTDRQKEIVRLVADGMNNPAIATNLGVTEHSVRNHLFRIFKMVGVSTRVELMFYVFSQRALP